MPPNVTFLSSYAQEVQRPKFCRLVVRNPFGSSYHDLFGLGLRGYVYNYTGFSDITQKKHKAREVCRYGCPMDMMNVIVSGANGIAAEDLLGPVTVGCFELGIFKT